MSKIITLDTTLANQISAGEVVERPLSVVKELVENSIDAGSTHIIISLQEWGKKEITIADNGGGIAAEDLPLAVKKYSTSKIKTLQDLHNVMTFGFRGEALASIASVSDMEITSKTLEDTTGYKLEILGGKAGQIVPAAIDQGTKITVKNLFYNTPARLHYLKTEKTEYNKIFDFLQKMSLAHPDIGFEFYSDDRQVFKYNENETLQDRIYKIYGEDFSEKMLPIESGVPGISLSGFINTPQTFFSNKNRQVLFVNHRVISSPIIYKAIQTAYNRFIPHGNFPAYILNFHIDPTQVDVNVHPRKMEIRFANESLVYRSVYNAVHEKLNNFSLVENTPKTSTLSEHSSSETPSFSPTNNTPQSPSFYTGSGTKFKNYSPYSQRLENPNQWKFSEMAPAFDEMFWEGVNNSVESLKKQEEGEFDLAQTPLGRIVGQAFNSYILVEGKDKKLHIIDQHAFAERILYEKLRNRASDIVAQRLLVPKNVDITPKEINIFEHNKEIFDDMGFEVEILGKTAMISTIPNFMDENEIENVFLGALEDISEYNTWKSTAVEEVRNKIFAFMSCRASIKFGNSLNLFEMNKLIHEGFEYYSASCPHGRACTFQMTLDELQKHFDR